MSWLVRVHMGLPTLRFVLPLAVTAALLIALACGGDDSTDPGGEVTRVPASSQTAMRASRTPDGPTSAPATSTPSVAATFTATRPSFSGSGIIDGIVLVGPQCPVEREDSPCPDAPLEATIVALDSGSREVARVRSGKDGRFTMTLPAGAYTLVPERFDPFPSSSEQQVIVVADQTTDVMISYDSGIR